MTLPELQGFLFAIANAPEETPPEQWLAMVGEGAGNGIEPEQVYNEIRALTLSRQAVLPANIVLRHPAFENGLPDSDLHAWSRGFLTGHSWLKNLWQAYLPEELVGNLSTAMLVLGFFGSEKLAEKFLAARGETSPNLESTAETMLSSLPGAMAEYVNISRSIAEVLAEPALDEKPQN